MTAYRLLDSVGLGGALVRYALVPTAAALCWCTLLFQLRHATIEQICWRDLDWAATRILASLGTVTGMLLAFRSNTALDRWTSGRRQWSDVQATSRSLLRLLVASSEGKGRVDAAIALIPFFSLGLMHQLRGHSINLAETVRDGLLRQDLLEQIPPRLTAHVHQSGRSKQTSQPTKHSEETKEKQMLNDDSPNQLRSRILVSTSAPTNVALTTLVALQYELDQLHSPSDDSVEAALSTPVYATCVGLVNSLTSHMTELEKVRDTLVPLSVARHFSRLLLIQTAVLPFMLVQRLSENLTLCCVVMAVVTSMLYGVDSFAAILGQPFGTDKEDLPLDRFVAEAQREWVEVRASVSIFATDFHTKQKPDNKTAYVATAAKQPSSDVRGHTAADTFSDDLGLPHGLQHEAVGTPDSVVDEDVLRDSFTF